MRPTNTCGVTDEYLRTANKLNLYLIERQTVTKHRCSWSPQKSRDREQAKFVFNWSSATYKKSLFAVRKAESAKIVSRLLFGERTDGRVYRLLFGERTDGRVYRLLFGEGECINDGIQAPDGNYGDQEGPPVREHGSRLSEDFGIELQLAAGK